MRPRIDGLALGVAAFALAAGLGATAPWIGFPLGAPVRGLDWDSAAPLLLQRLPALPVLLLLAAALGAMLCGARRVGACLLGLGVAAWLAVPQMAWLLDATWLLRYADEAYQRNSLQFFLHSFVTVPNTGIDRFLTRADAFQYLTDRAQVVMAMLAWGWYFCGLAVLAIALLLHRAGRLPGLAFCAPVITVPVLLLAAGAPVLRAEFHYRQADQRLALGDHAGALEAYAAALADDPVLGRSPTFVLNVAQAAYQKDGQANPSAQLYRTLASSAGARSLQAGKLQLAAARATLVDTSLLGEALAAMARRTEAELWLKQGMMQYQRGALELAALGFRQALAEYPGWQHARFCLARILTEQKAFDAGALLLQALATDIHDPSTRANVYNALGDLEAAAGRPQQARSAYAAAYALDAEGNLWAVKGLSGT